MTHSTVSLHFRRRAVTWPAVVFLLSAAGMLLTDVIATKLAPAVLTHPFGFFDLRIYRESAGVVLAGHPLYSARFQLGFGFTYPPFAALTFLGLHLLPMAADEWIVSLLNVALVVLIARLAVELAGPRRSTDSDALRWRRTWLVAALALWTEPVVTAIGYGQVDLVVAALVWFDLVRMSDSRWAGTGIGLAAAIKLTPLVFLPYLALTGRWRAALRSLQTFLASIALSFAVAPRDARDFWGRALFDTGRVTGHRRFAGRGPADQSLRGLLLRLSGTPHIVGLWVAACLVVGVGGLWLAVRAHRRGDDAFGCVLMAICGLLICPVSWTHHWAIATPGLVLLAASGRGSARICARATALALAGGSSAVSLLITADASGAHLGLGGLLLGDLYVIVGLLTLGCAGLLEVRRALAARARRPSPGHPRRELRGLPTGHIRARIGQSI